MVLKGTLTKVIILNSLSANITKWSNTIKQFVGKLPTNCLSVFDHFVGLTIKRLNSDLRAISKDQIKEKFFNLVELSFKTESSIEFLVCIPDHSLQ